MITDHRLGRHLPGRHAIDAYGKGGFRFGDMSHRGSILCLPSGVYAWTVTRARDVTTESLAAIMAEREAGIEFLLLGMGPTFAPLAETIRWSLRAARISVDPMDTGSAARTYNIMLAEKRPVAAALIAVE